VCRIRSPRSSWPGKIGHPSNAPIAPLPKLLRPKSFSYDTLVWLAIGLSHVPLVALFFGELYRDRPHYEFAPLVLASAAWFIWASLPDCPFVWGWRERILCYSLLATSLLGLTVATAILSPRLATMTLLLAVASWCIWKVGRLGISSLFPCWLLAWLAVPPPFQLDAKLIRTMQTITSRCTGSLLDLFRIPYLRQGNVFEIENRSLFVAETCSGVHSQLVLIAVSAILCLVLRRPLIHSLLLMLSAIVWSVIVNILRVLIVVIAETRGISLSEGWIHDALGYAVALVGLALVYSTDQLIGFALAPFTDEWIEEDFRVVIDPDGKIVDTPDFTKKIDYRFCRLWNRLTLFPKAHTWPATESAPSSRRTFPIIPFGIAFFLLGIAGSTLWQLTRFVNRDSFSDAELLYARLDDNTLPETIDNLTRQKHVKEQRDRSSADGMYSHSWEYSSPTELVGYGMDFPFVIFHDLTLCYYIKGWRVDSKTNREEQGVDPYVEVVMKRGLNEWSILHFSLHSADKRPLDNDRSPIDEMLVRMEANPIARRIRGLDLLNINVPSYQFQQFTRKPLEPTDDDLKRYRELFLSARRLWLQSNAFDQPDAIPTSLSLVKPPTRQNLW
jgi:exosortase